MTESPLNNVQKKKKIWSPAEEDFLLDLWADKIDDLCARRKKGPVYREMADEMRKWGSKISPQEIGVKLHNLSNRYRKEKRQMECYPEASSCDWRAFRKIHAILGGLNKSKFECIVEDSYEQDIFIGPDYKFGVLPTSSEISPASTMSDIGSLSEISGTSMKAVTKRKRETVINSILKDYKQTNATIIKERNHVRKVDDEMINIERERNEILKEFVTNAKIFQDNVTLMLNKIK